MTGQSAQRVDSDRGRFTGKVAAVTGAGSGIGRQLAYGLARRGARLALADLDELSRSIVVMRDLDGLPYQQIAEALDVPLATVKTRLLRARRELQRVVEAGVHT